MKNRASDKKIKKLAKLILEQKPQKWPSPWRELSEEHFNKDSVELDRKLDTILATVLATVPQTEAGTVSGRHSEKESFEKAAPLPSTAARKERGKLLTFPTFPEKRSLWYIAATIFISVMLGVTSWLYYKNWSLEQENALFALHLRIYGKATIHSAEREAVIPIDRNKGAEKEILLATDRLEVAKGGEVYFNAGQGVLHYVKGPARLHFISRNELQVFQIEHGSIALSSLEESNRVHDIVWETERYRYTLMGTVANLVVSPNQSYQKLVVYKGAIMTSLNSRSEKAKKEIWGEAAGKKSEKLSESSESEGSPAAFEQQEFNQLVKAGEAIEIRADSHSPPRRRPLQDVEQKEIALIEKKTTEEMLREPLPPSQKLPLHKISSEAVAKPSTTEPSTTELSTTEPSTTEQLTTKRGRETELKKRSNKRPPSAKKKPPVVAATSPKDIRSKDIRSKERKDSLPAVSSKEKEKETRWRVVNHKRSSFQFDSLKRYRVTIRFGISYTGHVEDQGNQIVIDNAIGGITISKAQIIRVQEAY